MTFGLTDLSLSNLMVVLTTDMEVIAEIVADTDWTRLNKQQADKMRYHVKETLASLVRLEGYLRDIGA